MRAKSRLSTKVLSCMAAMIVRPAAAATRFLRRPRPLRPSVTLLPGAPWAAIRGRGQRATATPTPIDHHEQSDRQPDQQAPHHHIITSDCRQELTPPVPATSAICLLASEVEPLSKTGGLADVAGALTKYLHGAGHDVRTFTPCYASIDRAACKAQPVAGVAQVPVSVGPQAYVFSLLRAELPGGAPVYLIDCPALYARTSLYTSEPDEHLRLPSGIPGIDRESKFQTGKYTVTLCST